jgi:hypothetical protein
LLGVQVKMEAKLVIDGAFIVGAVEPHAHTVPDSVEE